MPSTASSAFWNAFDTPSRRGNGSAPGFEVVCFALAGFLAEDFAEDFAAACFAAGFFAAAFTDCFGLAAGFAFALIAGFFVADFAFTALFLAAGFFVVDLFALFDCLDAMADLLGCPDQDFALVSRNRTQRRQSVFDSPRRKRSGSRCVIALGQCRGADIRSRDGEVVRSALHASHALLLPRMSTERDSGAPSSDARAQRRWMIGIGITVLFGLFGAVMAVLAYTSSQQTPGPRGPAGPAGVSPDKSSAPSPAPEPAPKNPGKGHS
ncbi:MAG: hypothetical protein H0T89_00520 [Deltaproteobacteria bacterium]|nr:hypothetical protein [Deltaproteobacteria bacterium]